jgi:hypothetical protein
MSEHYIVTADHGHLRIFRERRGPGQFTPGLEPVETMDFPAGVRSYTESATDMSGRFASSKQQIAGPGTSRGGMSIDERLPMQREEERRRARDVAAEIETFFSSRPDATWDFAAGAELNHAILDQLSNRTRSRLRRTLSKDLVNQRTEDLRAHFTASGR